MKEESIRNLMEDELGELDEEDKTLAGEILKEITKNPKQHLRNKEHIENFVKNNLSRQRLSIHDNKDDVFNFDAIYHFRTIQMCYLELTKVSGNRNLSHVAGKKRSLQSDVINNTFAFNEDIKNIEIDDNLYFMLKNTNNKIYARKMPYDVIFINKIIEINKNILCYGIGAVYGKDEKNKDFNTITLLGYDFNDNCEWRDTFSIGENGILGKGDYELFKNIEVHNVRKEICMILMNTLDFLNNPEVETRVIKWYNNAKRINKFKFPIPDLLKINIKGKLYKYIYEYLPNQQHSSPKHSFWVRGHYFHFWDEKKWNNIYSLKNNILKDKGYQKDSNGIISKWVMPYIKGRGILKNKKLYLKKQKEKK